MAATVILSTFYNALATPTVTLFADGSETLLDAGTSITESGTIPGQFSFSSSRTGLHGIMLYSAGAFLGTWWAKIPAAGAVVASESRSEAAGSAVYLSIPSAQAAASQSVNTITIYRGDTLRVSYDDLGDLTAREKLWLTIKRSKDDADSAAIVQITETDGLLTFKASQDVDSGQGSLTVTTAENATLEIFLHESLTAQLSAANGFLFDVQVLEATGVRTVMEGTCNIVLDVTRAVS